MRVQLLFAARGGCTDAVFARLDDEGRRAKARWARRESSG